MFMGGMWSPVGWIYTHAVNDRTYSQFACTLTSQIPNPPKYQNWRGPDNALPSWDPLAFGVITAYLMCPSSDYVFERVLLHNSRYIDITIIITKVSKKYKIK